MNSRSRTHSASRCGTASFSFHQSHCSCSTCHSSLLRIRTATTTMDSFSCQWHKEHLLLVRFLFKCNELVRLRNDNDRAWAQRNVRWWIVVEPGVNIRPNFSEHVS